MSNELIAFLITSTILAITPGPSIIYTVAYTLRYGTFAGFVSVIGINAGSYISIAIAAFGTSTLVSAFPHVLDAIRLAGAFYIFYLAIKLWPKAEASVETARKLDFSSYSKVFKNGVITSLLNPKDVIFYVSFIPQFITLEPDRLSYTWQFVILAAVYALTGLVTKTIFILSAGGMKNALNSKGSQVLNYVSSLVLFALSMYLIGTLFGFIGAK